jgi:hypothetical protein
VVVNGIPKTLLAPELAFRGLDGHMAKEKLNPFELATGLVASGTSQTSQSGGLGGEETQNRPTR